MAGGSSRSGFRFAPSALIGPTVILAKIPGQGLPSTIGSRRGRDRPASGLSLRLRRNATKLSQAGSMIRRKEKPV